MGSTAVENVIFRSEEKLDFINNYVFLSKVTSVRM